MIITSIEEQKKNKNRANVFIDYSFAFGLEMETCYKCGLAKGMEIDKNFIDKVIIEEEKNKSLNYSLKLLSFKQRTKKELKNKLGEKGYEDDIIEETVKKLVDIGYIDDEKYVMYFIKEKTRLNKLGRNKIKFQLINKGIDNDIIEAGLEELEEDVVLQNALELVKKRVTRLNHLSEIEKNQKLYRFLLGKGYDYSIIKKVINDLSEDEY
jgi:regulatory protein